MQSLKSILLAEVDNFFKQSFEQKTTDSTVPIFSKKMVFFLPEAEINACAGREPQIENVVP